MDLDSSIITLLSDLFLAEHLSPTFDSVISGLRECATGEIDACLLTARKSYMSGTVNLWLWSTV